MIEKLGDERLVGRIYYRMLDNLEDFRQERLAIEAAEAEARRLAEDALRLAEAERLLLEKLQCAATKIQARWRVTTAKAKVEKWRIFRDWAVLKVQQQIRVWLGRKEAQRRRRHRTLARIIREEKERGLMAIEDLLSRMYQREVHAAAVLNRLVRGLIGRYRAYRIKQAFARTKGYQLNVTNRDEVLRLMAEKRLARETEAKRRQEAAFVIQRIYRGYLARCRVLKMRYQIKKERLVLVIQYQYRMHLATRKAAAMRRWRANWELVRRTRATQGYLLRKIGFRHRPAQRRLVDFLGR